MKQSQVLVIAVVVVLGTIGFSAALVSPLQGQGSGAHWRSHLDSNIVQGLAALESGVYKIQNSGTETFFTVPPNRAFLLKQLWLENPGSTGDRSIRVRRAASGSADWLVNLNSKAEGEWSSFAFRLEPGDSLEVNTPNGANSWLGWSGFYISP